jgi:hypothetical protein
MIPQGIEVFVAIEPRGHPKNLSVCKRSKLLHLSTTLSIRVRACCEGSPWTSRTSNGRSSRHSFPRRSGVKMARADLSRTDDRSSTASYGC